MTLNIIIDVRNTRCYIARKRELSTTDFTYEPCANWQQLEALASEAVEAAGGGVTLSGLYPCPRDLATLALWAEDILALVTTPQEAEAEFALGSGTLRKAAERDEVRHRRAAGAWLLYKPDIHNNPRWEQSRLDRR